MLKKLTVTGVISILLMVQLFTIGTANVRELERELEETQRKFEELQQRLTDNTQEQSSVMNQLAVLEVQISQTEKELRSLEHQLVVTIAAIEVKEVELTEALEDLEFKEARMVERVRGIYKYGTVSYFAVLFQANSFSDLISRISMLRKMVRRDTELIEEVSLQKALVEQQKEDLETERNNLATLRTEVAQRRSLYQARSQARTSYLYRLENDAESHKIAMQELEQLSQELEEIIRLAKLSAVKGTGIFTWPAPGFLRVTSPFGYRTHPIFGYRSLHTGIDVGVPHGRTVVAADTGTVTHAGGLGGYGLTVMIDHGNGKTTLYAHNSRLLVESGDVVRKGDSIALVGSTGFSTGPHLHFEIRENGAPVDPLPFLR